MEEDGEMNTLATVIRFAIFGFFGMLGGVACLMAYVASMPKMPNGSGKGLAIGMLAGGLLLGLAMAVTVKAKERS